VILSSLIPSCSRTFRKNGLLVSSKLLMTPRTHLSIRMVALRFSPRFGFASVCPAFSKLNRCHRRLPGHPTASGANHAPIRYFGSAFSFASCGNSFSNSSASSNHLRAKRAYSSLVSRERAACAKCMQLSAFRRHSSESLDILAPNAGRLSPSPKRESIPKYNGRVNEAVRVPQ
jgi:hypothetical protein